VSRRTYTRAVAPQVLAALIAAVASLILAAFNTWTGIHQNRRMRDLEQLRSDLVIQQASDKARIDYEYDSAPAI
jgi:hypothetical protein